MDDVTWAILAIALTGAGGAATWWQFKEQGPVAGARALGWTLLVPAAWLTGVLALLARVTGAVTAWVSRLVFSPTFWIGVVMAGVGVALIIITGLMARRGLELRPADRDATPTAGAGAPRPKTVPSRPGVPKPNPRAQAPRTRGGGAAGDEFDDIEALLRKRGIE